jgi:hypothetical protein
VRRTLTTLAVGLAVLAALPAVASAQDNLGDVLGTTGLQNTLTQIGLPQISTPEVTDGNGTQQPATSEQPTTTPAKPAHSNGYYCRGQSKKHVRGQKGTPFSQCVTAMAKLQNGETASPSAACKPLSHKRVKGTKRTPFAACVAGGKRLILDLPA